MAVPAVSPASATSVTSAPPRSAYNTTDSLLAPRTNLPAGSIQISKSPATLRSSWPVATSNATRLAVLVAFEPQTTTVEPSSLISTSNILDRPVGMNPASADGKGSPNGTPST